jgi:hypothetical protein
VPTTHHVVQFSGGVGSWYTAVRVTERMVAGDELLLLFADTKTEDEDLYRFLEEAVADIIERLPEGCTGRLVTLADGRDVWQVFNDERYIGNSRIDPCSKLLKRNLIRDWMDANLDPATAVVYLGIDWTEAHRFERAQPRWAPWTLAAPLCEPPYVDKHEMMQILSESGIEAPRLYAMGFPHNNCGGFCVKAGMGQFKILLEQLPERYAYHEGKEAEFRERTGKDVTILRDRRGGTVKPLTLRAFRERIEAKAIDVDPYDLGGCACMTPD